MSDLIQQKDEEVSLRVKLPELVAWLCYLFFGSPWASFISPLRLGFFIWHGFVVRIQLDDSHKVLKMVPSTLNVQ